MKFRKKQHVIEAWQWDGHSTSPERPEWLRGDNVRADHNEEILIITTLEGDMTATKGDWIIKGIKGEIYPCKPDIFAASYDPETEALGTLLGAEVRRLGFANGGY
jgi:hypothetical protein